METMCEFLLATLHSSVGIFYVCLLYVLLFYSVVLVNRLYMCSQLLSVRTLFVGSGVLMTELCVCNQLLSIRTLFVGSVVLMTELCVCDQLLSFRTLFTV